MDQEKAYNDIILSLPTNDKWYSDDSYPIYLYQGFWYPSFTIRGAIAAQSQTLWFEPSPSDIVLASNPKSGTTWLKALAFAIKTRTLFPQSDPNNPLHSRNPHDLIPTIEIEVDAAISRGDLNLVATHLPFTGLPSSIAAHGCKIVYIWRDPKDAFVSLWHMCNKTRPENDHIPLQDAFELFCNGVCPAGPYWDHVLGYWKALQDYPERILLLKYEDMVDDVQMQVKRLAEFMGCPFSAEEEAEGMVVKIVEMCSFERLISLDVNKGGESRTFGTLKFSNDMFFRKAKVGDWSNYLTPEMGAKMDLISMDKLKDLLLA